MAPGASRGRRPAVLRAGAGADRGAEARQPGPRPRPLVPGRPDQVPRRPPRRGHRRRRPHRPGRPRPGRRAASGSRRWATPWTTTSSRWATPASTSATPGATSSRYSRRACRERTPQFALRSAFDSVTRITSSGVVRPSSTLSRPACRKVFMPAACAAAAISAEARRTIKSAISSVISSISKSAVRPQ